MCIDRFPRRNNNRPDPPIKLLCIFAYCSFTAGFDRGEHFSNDGLCIPGFRLSGFDCSF